MVVLEELRKAATLSICKKKKLNVVPIHPIMLRYHWISYLLCRPLRATGI